MHNTLINDVISDIVEVLITYIVAFSTPTVIYHSINFKCDDMRLYALHFNMYVPARR